MAKLADRTRHGRRARDTVRLPRSGARLRRSHTPGLRRAGGRAGVVRPLSARACRSGRRRRTPLRQRTHRERPHPRRGRRRRHRAARRATRGSRPCPCRVYLGRRRRLGFPGTLSNAHVVTLDGTSQVRLPFRVVSTFAPTKPFDPRTRDDVSRTATCWSRTATAWWSPSTRPPGRSRGHSRKSDDPKLSRPFSARASGERQHADLRPHELPGHRGRPRRSGSSGSTGPGLREPARDSSPIRSRRYASPNGNTLICDNKEAYRVIEVRSSDYAPSKPNLGYTASSIVWRYGTGTSGWYRAGCVAAAGRAAGQRQHADRRRVGQPRHRGRRAAGAVVWQLRRARARRAPTTRHLNAPCAMTRLSDGRTLIVGQGQQAVAVGDSGGTCRRPYGLGPNTPAGGSSSRRGPRRSPRRATCSSPTTHRSGFSRSATHPAGDYETGNLDLRMPGIKKWLTDDGHGVTVPAGRRSQVAYSLDGGAWKTLGSSAQLAFPNPTSCRFVKLRFGLSTSVRRPLPVAPRRSAGLRRDGPAQTPDAARNPARRRPVPAAERAVPPATAARLELV